MSTTVTGSAGPTAGSPAARISVTQPHRTPGQSARAAGPRVGTAPARTTRAELQRLDGELETLERAEALLREARALRSSDPRAAFELAHRALLRTAGVVIDRANRERTRRLPLNVWTALSRCGAMNRGWAIEAEPFVAERTRLASRADAVPDPALLDSHLETTAQRIAAVRAETMIALLPGGTS